MHNHRLHEILRPMIMSISTNRNYLMSETIYIVIKHSAWTKSMIKERGKKNMKKNEFAFCKGLTHGVCCNNSLRFNPFNFGSTIIYFF